MYKKILKQSGLKTLLGRVGLTLISGMGDNVSMMCVFWLILVIGNNFVDFSYLSVMKNYKNKN